MEDNVIQFPVPEVDPLLDGEAAETFTPMPERPDVLGLTMQSVWDISEAASVSRGKTRKVLLSFEQYFLMRLEEAYQIGARDGANLIIEKVEQAQKEYNAKTAEVIEMEADEPTNDPTETTGREEGVSPKA